MVLPAVSSQFARFSLIGESSFAQKTVSYTHLDVYKRQDYDKVKDLATPVFYSAIGADDVQKKDYKGAIDAYTKEPVSYTHLQLQLCHKNCIINSALVAEGCFLALRFLRKPYSR